MSFVKSTFGDFFSMRLAFPALSRPHFSGKGGTDRKNSYTNTSKATTPYKHNKSKSLSVVQDIKALEAKIKNVEAALKQAKNSLVTYEDVLKNTRSFLVKNEYEQRHLPAWQAKVKYYEDSLKKLQDELSYQGLLNIVEKNLDTVSLSKNQSKGAEHSKDKMVLD